MRGFPAYAGMVPQPTTVLAAMRGFPRPRGDGPAEKAIKKALTWVPLPTRGWSPPGDTEPIVQEGSPTHAGMVLCACG